MNKYAELRARQQQEFNSLPLGFAFNDRQFAETMQAWGLDPEKDLDKICSIGYGGFVQKKDAGLVLDTTTRHEAELSAAIAADRTGDGFICDMFLVELVVDGISGSAQQIHSVAKDMMQTRETIGKILARHTGHSLEEVFDKTSRDCYFSAGEAVAWGLADCVIDRF